MEQATEVTARGIDRSEESVRNLRFANAPAYLRIQVRWRIAGICLFLLTFFFEIRVDAQISPGPLAKAHQDLEGAANCLKCHATSTSSPSFRCVDCHREIGLELQKHTGLHATYPQAGPPGATCVKCHSDHNGVNFSMLHWDPSAKGFDHSKTGYSLDGKHDGVSCRSCHAVRNIASERKRALGVADVNRTWLGLSTSCISCHEDKHQGRFGTDCAQCHATSGWNTAKVDAQGFDHAKTRFPLTGMHAKVACERCHTRGAGGQPRYAGTPFASCAACHSDPHKGEFKRGCESCHSTATWKKSSFVSSFDHARTLYPLAGKHLEVPCLTCHKGGDFKASIAHEQCVDCHKPSPHGDQFAERADHGRCESCHTVDGFKPSTYSMQNHAATRFPLVAPHAAVKCAECHIPAGPQTRYRIKFALCIDCHKDAHEGQFAGEPWRNQCEQCHNQGSFKKSNMTLAMHQKTRFPLTGTHIAVACNECHKPLDGSTSAVFHFSRLSCASCHEDIHQRQFANRMSALDVTGKVRGCEACHSTKEWKDIARFDHATTMFRLEGTHRAVACMDCHRPPDLEQTMVHVQFAKASSRCADCHENPHSDQFGQKAADCAACHNAQKWRPSLFDHEKTLFSLKGGHQDVPCASCHSNQREVKGETVLFYKPTPTSCAACHGSDVPRSAENTHTGLVRQHGSAQVHVKCKTSRNPLDDNLFSLAHHDFVSKSKGHETFLSCSLPLNTLTTGIAVPSGRTGSIEPSASQAPVGLRKNASGRMEQFLFTLQCAMGETLPR